LTVLGHLGVDVNRIPDRELSGRPSTVFGGGQPISELVSIAK